jgi:DNA-binding transcriptional MerR regulator
MQIGQLAKAVGVSADTIRYYERSGVLHGPDRRRNGYRDYGLDDATHLRLLIDLRRLDVPLDLAASLARSCHSGHCVATSRELPGLIERQRRAVAARIAGLRALDDRLADLERHLVDVASRQRGRDIPGARATGRRALPLLDTGAPCCDAAGAVMAVVEGGCACCVPADDANPAVDVELADRIADGIEASG